jgi:hypothetical protein
VTTYHLEEARCPWCDKRLDAVTDADVHERGPDPGDLTICIQCASLLRLDGNLIPQKIAPAELQQLIREQPDLAEMIDIMQRTARSLDRRDRQGGAGGE